MTRRSFGFGFLWAFVGLAFLAGVVMGAVLPLWQRAALQNDVGVLEKRLAAKEKSADAAQQRVEELTEQVASLETSTEALTAENSRLTSEVASLRAPVQVSPPAAAGTAKSESVGSGSLVIVERSVTPSPVTSGESIVLVIKTRGPVTKATMRIDGPSGSSYDYTFSLRKVATEGDVSVWRTVLKAPGKGTYRCIAAAIRGSARTTAAAIPLTVN